MAINYAKKTRKTHERRDISTDACFCWDTLNVTQIEMYKQTCAHTVHRKKSPMVMRLDKLKATLPDRLFELPSDKPNVCCCFFQKTDSPAQFFFFFFLATIVRLKKKVSERPLKILSYWNKIARCGNSNCSVGHWEWNKLNVKQISRNEVLNLSDCFLAVHFFLTPRFLSANSKKRKICS